MRDQIQQVDDFHRLIGAADVMRMPDAPPVHIATVALDQAAQQSLALSKQLKALMIAARNAGDSRLIRGHLVLEETGEFLEALAKQDEVAALDALCDLLYVVFGSGLVLDLPLLEGFEEVHKSNMSKRPPKGDVRAQDKGAGYRPPNLQAVLAAYRARTKGV